jgi:hypothetical protein
VSDTAMDEEQLIMFLQQYEELYHFTNPNYSNKQWQENIWDETGQLMKQQGMV